jgi:hypothetical protein
VMLETMPHWFLRGWVAFEPSTSIVRLALSKVMEVLVFLLSGIDEFNLCVRCLSHCCCS